MHSLEKDLRAANRADGAFCDRRYMCLAVTADAIAVELSRVKLDLACSNLWVAFLIIPADSPHLPSGPLFWCWVVQRHIGRNAQEVKMPFVIDYRLVGRHSLESLLQHLQQLWVGH